jgi:hypothetical protein
MSSGNIFRDREPGDAVAEVAVGGLDVEDELDVGAGNRGLVVLDRLVTWTGC